MIDFLMLLACVPTRLFRSRARLEAEILVLRHQLNILQRKSTKRAAFKSIDRHPLPPRNRGNRLSGLVARLDSVTMIRALRGGSVRPSWSAVEYPPLTNLVRGYGAL